MQKVNNLKFHYSFNNFVRPPPPWRIHEFLGSKSGVLFQRICCLNPLPPYGPMLWKTKKKLAKIQNWKFYNSLNNFGRETISRSMHDFLGVNIICTLRGDIV